MSTSRTPRGRRARDAAQEAEEERGSPVDTSITIGHSQLQLLLQTFQQTQADFCARMLQEVRSSTPAPAESSAAGFQPANFSRCTARFSGAQSEEVDAFIDAVEVYKTCLNISNENAVKGLSMLLTGTASVWWIGLRDSVKSWSDALEKLRYAFGERRPPFKIYKDLFAMSQGEDNTDIFIAKARSLLARLPRNDLNEKVELDLVFGLLDRRIRKRLDRDSINSFDELLKRARSIEESLVGIKGQQKQTNCLGKPHTDCKNNKDDVLLQQNKTEGADTTSAKRVFCGYCKKWGHSKFGCKKLQSKNTAVTDTTAVTEKIAETPKPQISCYGCGAKNFIRSNCPECSKKNAFYSMDVKCASDVPVCNKPTVASVCSHPKTFLNTGFVKGESPKPYCRPKLNIEILGSRGTALVDTGSKGCIAGESLHAFLVEKGHPLTPSTRIVKLADGCARVMDVYVTMLEVRLMNKVFFIEFIILPEAQNNESLLGIDFLTQAKLVFDFGKSCWYFSDSINTKYELLFESVSPRTSCAALDVLRDDEGTGLKEHERDELSQLLMDFRDIFNLSGQPTPFAVHHIDTGDHSPIAMPPYRLTPAKKEIMQRELDKMLAEDIVEECESAWGSPALLVPKQDGSFRFCVDYRRINAITKTDAYPMPRIDELLQATKTGCVMSTLDLRSGYWQVPVAEKDRDKTAFVTPFGTYRFKRMPFGLKNAPASFQRLIDKLRCSSALKDVTVLAYLDDLLVISKDFPSHMEDLRAVFRQLSKFGLRANREKCVFTRQTVKYLGHVITQEGVLPDEGKVCAILDMKPPASLKHLRTFIQTCSWFRKFIPGFAQVSEPLTRLTRKNQPWQWGEEQMSAFENLKKLLTSAPILIQSDYSKPFILRTDASNYALGAVLLQGEKNQERPIEYASRLLNGAERNYTTTEREALAVVWALDRFRGYIDGHPVKIGSDHQPLKWLLTLKSPSGRLVRWALKIQSYDLQFEYTPGKANVVADALSRPSCTDDTRKDCGVCSVVIDLPVRSPSELRLKQKGDPEIEKIIKELEGEDDVAAHRWTERGYLLERGVLYRYNPDLDNEEPQLVIPADLQEEILKECHDDPIAGHPGNERTYQKVAQRYFFPGMRKKIADYVKSCSICQRYKASNEKPPGLIQTPVLNQRNEVLAIDLFGPLPEGENGEKWILLVEDTATRWVELFALKEATSETCAKILIEEYFLRFGLCRRIISDNGVQFISAVMQQSMYFLGIQQNLIPLYHPEANPAERKNRDLKVQLSILVKDNHKTWPTYLPHVRFAMNSSRCATTGCSPAYVMFAREMRTPFEANRDLRGILSKENFIPQITPYLKNFIRKFEEIRERAEHHQDKKKSDADEKRRSVSFNVGDLVLVNTHNLSNAAKGFTKKFVPKRDGPYVIVDKPSPTTYKVATPDNPDEVLGKFHVNELTGFQSRHNNCPKPIIPKRSRGRPRQHQDVLDQPRGRDFGLKGEDVATTKRITKLPRRYRD